MKNAVVFFGGKSVEHDVSVITGVMTANSIDKTKYNAVPIYVSRAGEWYSGESLLDLDGYKNVDFKRLQRVTFASGDNRLYEVKGKKLKELCTVAVAINCMHGGIGENGSLSGYLNFCGIPLASPSLLSSAVSMDKNFTKTALKGLGVNTLPYCELTCMEEWEGYKKDFSFPLIIKPTLLGSSIGISVAKDAEELESGLSYALRFCKSAIIEPCLTDFQEINCAAYRDDNGNIKVSECERPVGRTEILSFGDKYVSGKRVFPADIDKKFSNKIKEITKKVYIGLNFSGVIRIDYFLKGEEIYLNEINSVPGSLAYYLFGDTLKSFTVMLDQLLRVAEQDFAIQSAVITDYSSGILSSFGSKGAKGR